MDLIEKLRAAIELAEQHAEKDLWAIARCTANPSEWQAWYGHNLPESTMRIGEDVVLRVVTPNHEADIFAVSRAIRLLEGRAKAAKLQVAAHRKILELHVIYDTYPPGDFWKTGAHLCEICTPERDGDRIHDDGPACATVLALAVAYGIEP